MPDDAVGVNWRTASTTDKTELTISSGDITVTLPYHTVDTQSDAATDNLDGITPSVTAGSDADGYWLIIRPVNDARTIVIRHNQNAAAAKNILIPGDADVTLDDEDDFMLLVYDIDLDTNGAWVAITWGPASAVAHAALTAADSGHTIAAQAITSVAASTTLAAHAELATTAETSTGTDTARVIPVSALPLQIQDSKYNFVADTASDDDYLIALTPTVAGYATGQIFSFTAQTANTGACTLNVNGLGAKAIKKLHDQDPASNDIEAGQIVIVQYDGTVFQMQSQIAAAGGGGTPTLIEDADQNTKVQTEESADENKIRMDVEGTQRFLLQTADPHYTLTGNVDVDGEIDMEENANASSSHINIKMTTTGVEAWTGIDINPDLTTTGNSRTCTGVLGQVAVTGASASSGHNVRGLNFKGIGQAVSSAVTYAGVTGMAVLGKGSGIFSSGDVTVTSLIGASIKTDLLGLISGTGTATKMIGIEIGVETSDGSVTDYDGLNIADYTVPSGTNNLIECGTSTPTTTSGLFRMTGNFTAAANRTPLFVSEGATPTTRQFRTFDPGNGGANFTAGQLVCLLV